MNAALKIDDACFIISLLVALRQIGGFNPKESPRKGGEADVQDYHSRSSTHGDNPLDTHRNSRLKLPTASDGLNFSFKSAFLNMRG